MARPATCNPMAEDLTDEDVARFLAQAAPLCESCRSTRVEPGDTCEACGHRAVAG